MKDEEYTEELTDSELIERARKGESALLDQLIERYYDGIFRYCCYKTGSREAAYDCTQETFLHFLRYLDLYLEQKKFKAWIYRIASNVCTDYFRKRAKAPLGEEALELLQAEDPKLHQTELSDTVEKLLAALPAMQREVIELYYFEGLKLREIAVVTDAKLSAVKSRFRQGMEKMKKQTEKQREKEGAWW